MKYSFKTVLIALMVLGSACEDAVQQAPPPAEPPPAEPVVVEEEVTLAPQEDYVRPEYPDTARRNPFMPTPDVIQPTPTSVDGEVRSLEPLEQFGLGQLNLVAIVSEVAVPTAMFVDPTGFGHFVKRGDRIGRNSGVIADIRENEVEVTEGGDDEDAQTLQRIVKLRDIELTVGEGGLSEDERAALERLMQTEEGRQALQRSYQELAPGATATEQQETGAAPAPRPGQGFAPPSQN